MNKTTIVVIIVIVLIAGLAVYEYSQLSPASNDSTETSQNKDDQEILVPGPKIEVSPSSYDFGTVIYGDVVKHTFTIGNIGSEPLEILRLSTSCGCTKAQVAEQDKIIAPGNSVSMLVSFDPAVHESDEDLGDVTRVVYIKTNDPDDPETEVTISALVIKEDQTSQVQANNKTNIIQVTAKRWEFIPNPIKVKQGDRVRLEIVSQDVDHSFSLPDFNIDEKLEPGKEVVVEFVADKKGIFDFRCAILCGVGHSGMKGQLIVE